jgi:hypothetical protein
MCIHIVRPAKDLIEQESSMGKVECAFSWNKIMKQERQAFLI